ncbi:phosphoribosyltransferase family protein, partial [Escherichia coli]|uniref:phosphoribosyltransferase family protein n=1 Tax=Escherichia coli TaxID=562 RepID=UPI00404957D7
DEDIRGKDVLIVEDIIDSGNTLSKVREILSLRRRFNFHKAAVHHELANTREDLRAHFKGVAIPSRAIARQHENSSATLHPSVITNGEPAHPGCYSTD